MTQFRHCAFIVLLPALFAQSPARPAAKSPFQTQSPSTLKYSIQDHQDVIEITNVNFELVASPIPGRPRDEFLVLRKSVRSREAVGDIGIEATTTVEAWPLGADLKQKPLYTVTAQGNDPVTKNSDLLIISRGLEEVSWWSVYKLGNGAQLFDTYVPLLQFSLKDMSRYAGLEVPPDDTKDKRLKASNVVAVLTYASAERVIREALITADASRTLKQDAGGIRLAISQDYPARPLASITVPIANDDLDLAHAQLPAGLHVARWTR